MERQDQTLGIGFVVLAAFGFGGIPTLTSLAYDAGINVPTALAIRFGLAALLAWAVLLVRGQGKVPTDRLVGLLLVGACLLANTSTFFLAVSYAPAASVVVIFYTYPAVVTFLSIAFLGERLTLMRGLALILALAGCLLTLELKLAGLAGPGLLLAFISGILYAGYIVLGSRFMRGMSASVASTWIMSGVALTFLGYGLTTSSLDFGFEARGWPIMVAMVLFSTVIAFQLFLAGVLRIGPTLASILGTVEPVAAVTLAAIVLGEDIGPYQIGGGVLIVSAVLLLRMPVIKRPFIHKPPKRARLV